MKKKKRETKGIMLIGSMILIVLLALTTGCAKRAETPEPEFAPPPPVEETPPPAPQESLSEVPPQPDIKEVQGRLQDIHFDFDKYNIRPDAREILAQDYEALKALPGVEILIEGHCDERGTVEYNLALGQKRAEAARDYLISLGMDPGRINTISYGEELPLDPRHNEEAWAKNRRAHIVILKK